VAWLAAVSALIWLLPRLVQYLRTIGYTAWIEDTNGNEIEETIVTNAIKGMLHE
jgi:hypothetical protein